MTKLDVLIRNNDFSVHLRSRLFHFFAKVTGGAGLSMVISMVKLSRIFECYLFLSKHMDLELA